jgi:hypothetical protein
LTMNVSRFHVSCIQETDYRLHYACGGLLNFLEHFKHRMMCKRGSIVCKLCLCLLKGPTNSARVRTIVTTMLQRQYLQTELILWIHRVYNCSWCSVSWCRCLRCFIFLSSVFCVITHDSLRWPSALKRMHVLYVNVKCLVPVIFLFCDIVIICY